MVINIRYKKAARWGPLRSEGLGQIVPPLDCSAESLKGREHLRDPGLDGRIILKKILKK
jgi:hypothetical protein